MWPGAGPWQASVGSVAVALLVAAVIARFFIPRLWSPSGIKPRGAASSAAAAGARLPAGSLGWPLLGETLAFIFAAYSQRPESFAEERRLLYGSVFKSHLWGAPAVVSSDPEVSRAVLQADASAFVPWYPRSLMELMGDSSILVLGGGLQRRVHGLAGAFFKSPHLKARVTADMQRRVGRAMDAWRRNNGGSGGGATVVRVQDEAKSIVFEILVRALIGLDEGHEMQYLRQQFKEFIAGLISLPVKLPGTQLYRSLKAKKRMTKLIQKIIQEKRRQKRITDECDNLRETDHPRDMIDVLLGNGSDELTNELISDNMIDFMIPAEDSVPVLITLAVKYLSECPLALQQLEEENMELKRQKSGTGETLEWTDYMSLTFTQHVITETLRMGNIINGIMRKAVRDVEVRGHLIPKGWRVLVYFRAVHLDAAVHDDPHAFNPWRWEERTDVMSSSGFTPFGGGQRLCPGLDLARLEASIFLHHLVTSFRWVAEEDAVVNFPTVRLSRGMPIAVTPRT
ncbi:Cytochrome P450 90D2 [Dichanthelium oligosanthes]|uniref:Cytochrome P450 90D2 n=1 Tax=Dichanthelium oligosanthes TaxID=888268 RepID=A0A1E5VTZ5_9POAL|nr:Cytochrome P450 90D2 [Dichanthelium oligosanthes]